MKKDIHPEYYPNAKIHCACGNIFYIGSTKKEFDVEICYKCHPFYTGENKLVDTAGRVEKFKAKMEKAKEFSSRSKKEKREIKNKKKETKKETKKS